MADLVKIIFGTMAVFMIATLTGFISPFWITGQIFVTENSINKQTELVSGLFYVCAIGGPCDVLPWNADPIYLLMVRLLVIVSTLCMFLSIGLNGISLRTNRYSYSTASAATGILAGLTGVAAVSVFGGYVVDLRGWSFFLSAGGSGTVLLLSSAASVLSIVASKNAAKTSYANQGYAMEWTSPTANS